MQNIGFYWSLMQQQYWPLYTHNIMVGRLSLILVDALDIPVEEKGRIYAAASIHDIGKMLIRRNILDKPDSLNYGEWGHVKRHTVLGANFASQTNQLQDLSEMIRYHHERWDGRGYEGLVGDEIPLGARVIAIADTLSAMTEPRSYRRPCTVPEAIAEIVNGDGTQFDPLLIDALHRCRFRLESALRNPAGQQAMDDVYPANV